MRLFLLDLRLFACIPGILTRGLYKVYNETSGRGRYGKSSDPQLRADIEHRAIEAVVGWKELRGDKPDGQKGDCACETPERRGVGVALMSPFHLVLTTRPAGAVTTGVEAR